MAGEYILSIVCDHSRQPGEHGAPARVVSRIGYFPKPVTAGRVVFGWLEWREFEPDDPAQPPALQTYFGEARRLGTHPHKIETDETGAPTDGDFERLADLVPGMAHAQRWRFFCPDCHDTEPMRHERMVGRLEELRHAGDNFVLLRQIAPMGL